MRLVVVINEADGDAIGAGAAGAADAVNVIDGRARQVVVDDGGEVLNVDSARSDIGGDQYVDGAVFKQAQHIGSFVLIQIAMESVGLYAVTLELGGEVAGGAFTSMARCVMLPTVGTSPTALTRTGFCKISAANFSTFFG